MIHGADIWSYGKEDIIDFSSNINPLGPPKGLKEYLMEEFEGVTRYPDIKYRRLKKNIGEYLGVDPKHLIVGNGAMEIIDEIISCFDHIIIPYPSFSEYQLRTDRHKKEKILIPMKDDLSLDVPSIKKSLKNTGNSTAVILASPNNPTGFTLKDSELKEIYDTCLEMGHKLILDEAFIEFTRSTSAIDLLANNNYKNVQIIRAATKVFGLPGIRLGYGVLSEDMRVKIESQQLPWTVNSFAESAGHYIFKDKAYLDRTRDYIEGQREVMMTHLKEIPQIRVYPSQANYIFMELKNTGSQDLFTYLLERNILIRTYCKDIHPHQAPIRVCVHKEKYNQVLISHIKEFFHEK